jgi:hypothetical protein
MVSLLRRSWFQGKASGVADGLKAKKMQHKTWKTSPVTTKHLRGS